MASSKQTKKIISHGKHIIKSTSNKRPQSTLENDVELQNTDDSHDESSQPKNAYKTGAKEKRQKVVRPNAFLSFRITNQQIINHANEIQKHIIDSNPLLSKASIAIPTLHITLMVFALKTDDDKKRAQQSLVDICNQVSLAKLPQPRITFNGISHFNNKVLFMNPVKDDHLDVLARIAEICRETYEKNGIQSTDVREFNPHLTLFKLSKARDLHRKGVKRIDQCWDSKYNDHHFGIEHFRSIHLCNMMKKQKDGYYEVFHEQHLFNDDSNSFPPMSNTDSDITEKPIEIKNITVSPVHTDNNQASLSYNRAIVVEITGSEPSLINESTSLLQSNRATNEERHSNSTSFFRYACNPCCSSCSIV